MAIQKHSDYYTVVMEILRDEGPLTQKELRKRVADRVGLSDEDRSFTNAKGLNIFGSRIHWAGAVLVLAGLLERPRRAQIGISELGLRVLAQNPQGISEDLVRSQDAYKEMEERSMNRPGFVGDFILWKRGWSHGQKRENRAAVFA